ncbi:hypothetical protein BZZ01_04410 [Nostocales cyanobacterium HT-58-2]|nr:hypothetical protein BZZ01_04410 [Nostocales cyanobacterium HT-58-2]
MTTRTQPPYQGFYQGLSMKLPQLFLIFWAALIFWVLGQIWLVQIVVYPLFAKVGAADYV